MPPEDETFDDRQQEFDNKNRSFAIAWNFEEALGQNRDTKADEAGRETAVLRFQIGICQGHEK